MNYIGHRLYNEVLEDVPVELQPTLIRMIELGFAWRWLVDGKRPEGVDDDGRSTGAESGMIYVNALGKRFTRRWIETAEGRRYDQKRASALVEDWIAEVVAYTDVRTGSERAISWLPGRSEQIDGLCDAESRRTHLYRYYTVSEVREEDGNVHFLGLYRLGKRAPVVTMSQRPQADERIPLSLLTRLVIRERLGLIGRLVRDE